MTLTKCYVLNGIEMLPIHWMMMLPTQMDEWTLFEKVLD